MRKLLPPVVLLLALVSMPANAEKPADITMDSIRIERLAGLCELWGVIKYFHPYFAYKDIEWDKALIKTIPLVRDAEMSDDYRRAILHLVSFLKDPNTFVRDESYEYPRSTISDMPNKKQHPSIIRTEDDIAIISASNFDELLALGFVDQDSAWYRNITSKARGVIVDARCLIGPEIKKYDNNADSEVLLNIFTEYLLGFVNDTIKETSIRSLIYSPFAYPEITGHRHMPVFFYQDGNVLYPEERGLINPIPVVFIINEGSADLLPVLGFLQDKTKGAIVFEGPFDRDGGIKTFKVSLSDSVEVEVRLTEIIRHDSTEAIHPDLVLPYTTDTSLLESPPIKTAVEIINGIREVPPVVGNFLSPIILPRLDITIYENMPAPKLEYRLLALFQFWNEVKFFSPHLEREGGYLASFLRELIPVFEAAEGRKAFDAAMNQMTRKLGGISVYSNAVQESRGPTCFPSFNVESLEGQTIVSFMEETESSSPLSELEVGDIILELDGENIGERRNRLAESISGPTPQALQSQLDYLLLGSQRPSPFNVKIRKADGRVEQYEIPRRYGPPSSPLHHKYSKPFHRIDDSLCHVWIHRLNRQVIEDSIEKIIDSKGLIIDLRQNWYSLDPACMRLASIIATSNKTACLKRGVERRSPDPEEYTWSYSEGEIAPDNEFQHRGKTVALIDGSTHGKTEELCLYLKAAGAIFIGTSTFGRPGEDTHIHVPGSGHAGIKYLSIDIRHPDDSPVYGVGIQPDIIVERTIEGIRQGRDEILDAAVDYLTGVMRK